jgi:hypothetical protein
LTMPARGTINKRYKRLLLGLSHKNARALCVQNVRFQA